MSKPLKSKSKAGLSLASTVLQSTSDKISDNNNRIDQYDISDLLDVLSIAVTLGRKSTTYYPNYLTSICAILEDSCIDNDVDSNEDIEAYDRLVDTLKLIATKIDVSRYEKIIRQINALASGKEQLSDSYE